MRTISGGVLLACVVLLSGGPSGAQTPQFRAGTELVVVDVVAMRADGFPASDLTQNDFEIYEDGRRQSIRTFQLIDLIGRDRTADPSGVFSNRTEPGAVFAMVLDALSVQPRYTRNLRQWAQRFVDEQVRLDDYVGVMNTNKDSAMLLTRDRDVIRAKIAQAYGGGGGLAAPTSTTLGKVDTTPEGEPQRPDFSALDLTDPGAELRITTERVVDTLRQVVDYLAGIPARRKSVLLFTQGVAMNLEALANAGSARGFIGMEQLLDAARAGNVAIYGIDPRGLAVDEEVALAAESQPQLVDFGIDGLRDLARITGGRAIVNRNDLDTAMVQIGRENRTYFLIGYEPPEGGGNRLKQIEVRTRAPGVTLLYRTTRMLARDATRRERGPEAAPLPGGSLSVVLAPSLFPNPDGGVALAVPFELGEKLPAGTKVQWSLLAIDERGRQAAGQKGTTVATTGAGTGLARLSLEGGRYQIRLHATSGGQQGLAIADIVVPGRAAASPVCGGFLLAQREASGVRPNVTRRFRSDAPIMIAAVVSSKSALSDVSFAAVPRSGRGELFFQVPKAPAVGPGMWRYELTLSPPLPVGQLDVVLVQGDTEIPGCRAEMVVE